MEVYNYYATIYFIIIYSYKQLNLVRIVSKIYITPGHNLYRTSKKIYKQPLVVAFSYKRPTTFYCVYRDVCQRSFSCSQHEARKTLDFKRIPWFDLLLCLYTFDNKLSKLNLKKNIILINDKHRIILTTRLAQLRQSNSNTVYGRSYFDGT